jgi:subtilisin-like proprotein convertase family protein
MRNVWPLFFALALLVSGLTAPQAQVTTLPLSAGQNHLTLVSQTDDQLIYEAAIGELEAMQVSTREGDFTRLFLPGFHASHTEGAPELPMMNRLVEIPYGAQARVEVTSLASRSIWLAEQGLTAPLFPAQPSMPKNADPEAWPFIYDQAAYGADRVAQEPGRIIDCGQLRGVRVGRLELSPVEYFPAENRILVHERFEVRVTFEGADPARGDELKARTSSSVFEPVYHRLDGYRGIHEDYPDRVRDVVTMVIVTHSMFETQLQEFVDWKTERGFQVIVGVLGSPEVGSTKESIQAYIRNLYNSGTPERPAPSFALFVGDVEQVPTWDMSGDASDRPYCAIDADLMPDIYYGRLSAMNTTQLQAILDKTLMYDQFVMPDPSYLSEVVMIAGMDSGHGQVWANGQINYGTTYYFNTAHGITSHTHLYPASGGQDAQIVQEVSEGCAYVNYTAHGSTTSWSDPSFTQSDINGLQNYGRYCLAVGNCCLTSTYDIPECFAETFLRAAGKGAIGYIGGSNSTYWDEDYYWGVGYRTSIVEHPVFDAAHMGGYDGLFHDHGEAMAQWYVTNDALIFCGNLAVTESGSGLTTYYWNIYNLMGDPSLSTYLGVPETNPVVHPETIFTTWTSCTVEAVPGSYVGLTLDGELIGAGTVGESGTLELPIWADPLTPGYARLVVMAQNREPYFADINVIIPAVVTIDPDQIDANVETAIDVGVYEYDGTTPKPGIEIWAAGLGYESTHAITGAEGHCTITVNYPFGPTLDIVGKDPADPWELFREPITVVALPLTNPNLWVTTTIGLADTFALNLPGTLRASATPPGYTLWAYLNDEYVASAVDRRLTITPSETGTVRGILSLSGYDIYAESFPVIEAFGTLTGHVYAGGSPAVGASVRGYDAGQQLVFEVTTNALGNYDVGEELVVASYTITADYFGFLHWEQPYFLNYGANTLDIDLVPAPSGTLAGTITEAGTGSPLAASVKVYRSDTLALYAETMSDPATGAYSIPALPYFDYVVTVRASHHIPQTLTLTIAEPLLTQDFVLVTTIGDLLVLNDGSSEKVCESKVDPKTGQRLADGYAADAAKSATDIANDLELLGYNVLLENLASSIPTTWPDYDLIVVASGNNTNPLIDATARANLISFVTAGGHLLIEGGEVAYDHQSSGAFASAVLHINDWVADNSGNVTVAAPAHPVMSVPNTITGPITMTYIGYGDEDACVTTTDAVRVGAWTSYLSNASIIAYDPNAAPEGGQIVFFAFNYSAMDAAVRPQLLENAARYLLVNEVGDCSVSGTAHLVGEQDHSGIRVEAIPNGGYVITGPTGEYMLPGLYAGNYTIRASKQSWTTETQEVTLGSGQQLTGIDFALQWTPQVESCESPALTIPDSYPTGVSDQTAIALNGEIAIPEVYVNITHTYIGDLIVRITSPAGTTLTLHNRSGGSADNLVGWYPSQLTPYQSLDALIGQEMQGTWTLFVSDNAGSDIGVLNSWCVRITYEDASAIDGSGTPQALALYPSAPNPVSRAATIRFDLPETSPVDLAIFDVTGRRVATLMSGQLGAGQYAAVWQGRDDAGRVLENTVYFCRLQAGGQEITRKLMLLK